MDFDYHPGFKIGFGISTCRDDWALYLESTRLKSHETSTFDASNYSLIIRADVNKKLIEK